MYTIACLEIRQSFPKELAQVVQYICREVTMYIYMNTTERHSQISSREKSVISPIFNLENR